MADMTPSEVIGFVIFVGMTIGFAAWVAYLAGK
jgi:hypothetical protein